MRKIRKIKEKNYNSLRRLPRGQMQKECTYSEKITQILNILVHLCHGFSSFFGWSVEPYEKDIVQDLRCMCLPILSTVMTRRISDQVVTKIEHYCVFYV